MSSSAKDPYVQPTVQNTAAPAFDPNQTYRFDPVYGFVPAENNGDTEENPAAQNAAAYANAYQGYGPYQGQTPGFAVPYGAPAYMAYPPFHAYGMHRFGHYPYCPPFMAQQAAYAQQNPGFAAFGPLGQNADSDDARDNNAAQRQGLTQEKIQEIYAVVNDAINGNPDPGKLLGILQGTNGDFWKGLAIGAGAVLLFNCTPLKAMLAGLFASQAATEETEQCGCTQADEPANAESEE